MKAASFLPAVTLYEDGSIDIDWSSSYSNEWDTETFDVNDGDETEPRLSERLDEIIGKGTQAEKTERFAAYLAAHVRVPTSG